MKKIKKGAASFYIVAFATLFLTIIALSFAAVVISEINRTRNADLSQSAYDSALAGIEDAKVALLNYQSCVNMGYSSAETPVSDGNITCGEIIYYMNHQDCNMVGHMLGRIDESESGKEVLIQEETENNMQQAYTCVEIETDLKDYRATLTSENNTHVVPINVKNPNDVKYIRVKWYSAADGSDFKFNNVTSTGIASFPVLTTSQTAVPPTVLVELAQTATSFNLKQMRAPAIIEKDKKGNATTVQSNRASLTLVPYPAGKITGDTESQIYVSNNVIKKDQVAATNNQQAKNLPFMIECGENDDFACAATIELPDVIPGVDGSKKRGADTFTLTISIPYGQPDTDFAVELCDKNGCNGVFSGGGDDSIEDEDSLIKFLGSQIKIDSTGRADNLYRRVEMRLGNEDVSYPISTYAITATSEDSDAINKNIAPSAERGNGE